MRSCLIATALARRLGMDEEEVADTFYTALLDAPGVQRALARDGRRLRGRASACWRGRPGRTSPTPRTSPTLIRR